MFPNNNFYVNVNTPQNNDTWKRVWDAPDVIEVQQRFQPFVPSAVHAEPFTPDPTCPVSLTYYGEGENIPADNTGKPLVDFESLTICEKMNIYINRTTGQMFFLDPATCTWQTLKGEFASAIKWNSIVDAPKIYSQVEHRITDSDNLNVSLDEAF